MSSQPVSRDAEKERKTGAGPSSLKSQPQSPSPVEVVENLEDGVQDVHEELRKATITQITLTLIAVLAMCYVAKIVLVTIFTAILIAFILAPIVSGLQRIRLPRAVGSALAVLLLLGVLYGLSCFFYQRAIDFAHQVPQMSGEIKKIVGKYQQNAESIRNSAQNVVPQTPEEKNAVPVKVQQSSGITGMLGSDLNSFTDVLLAAAFVPFLVYFMLTWQERTRRATVRLFPVRSRLTAYQTLGKISEMMRGFIVGNFIIGLFMALVSGALFAFLHLPYFYFLGLISGFLSLIPYLGIVLAILPPIVSGIGVTHGSGMLLIVVVILALHIFSLNVLYPKIIGGRLELNPLAVSLGLLVWGWIWGAMGLILAVPVVGAVKIICDNVQGLEPFGQWLGDEEVARAVVRA
jgi:predicted PurR-regulated permease PerM